MNDDVPTSVGMARRSGDAVEASSASARAAQFARTFDACTLTAANLATIRSALLDTLCVAVAGAREPASAIAQRYAARRSVADGARVWASGVTTTTEAAALANGIAAHVLDYDDVTAVVRGHVSAALLPSILALGESRGASGMDVAAAYTVGFETMCRIARAMAWEHYAKGWHSTATLGVLGATCACASLARLSSGQAVSALAIAVAQAGGTRQNFGTMAKSFQAGHCGAAALRAVELAALGFTGSSDALDGELGFATLYGGGEDLRHIFDESGSPALALDVDGLEVKKYPMCYATHRALDGLLDLRAAHGLRLPDVDAVFVRTNRGGLAPLIHHRPVTGLDAKFSMEYAVAAALHDGNIGLGSFTDEAVRRPAIQAFLPRVTAVEDGGPSLPRCASLSVRLRDGNTLDRRVERLRGAANDPLDPDEMRRKARDCLGFAGASAGADTLFAAIDAFPEMGARELVDVLCRVSNAQKT